MVLLKIGSLSTLDQKKKKMSQKNTTYQHNLKTLPILFKPKLVQINTQDARQKVAYLVFLDMLFLLKM